MTHAAISELAISELESTEGGPVVEVVPPYVGPHRKSRRQCHRPIFHAGQVDVFDVLPPPRRVAAPETNPELLAGGTRRRTQHGEENERLQPWRWARSPGYEHIVGAGGARRNPTPPNVPYDGPPFVGPPRKSRKQFRRPVPPYGTVELQTPQLVKRRLAHSDLFDASSLPTGGVRRRPAKPADDQAGPTWVPQHRVVRGDVFEAALLPTGGTRRGWNPGNEEPPEELPVVPAQRRMDQGWRADVHLLPTGGARWEFIFPDAIRIPFVRRRWQEDISPILTGRISRWPERLATDAEGGVPPRRLLREKFDVALLAVGRTWRTWANNTGLERLPSPCPARPPVVECCARVDRPDLQPVADTPGSLVEESSQQPGVEAAALEAVPGAVESQDQRPSTTNCCS